MHQQGCLSKCRGLCLHRALTSGCGHAEAKLRTREPAEPANAPQPEEAAACEEEGADDLLPEDVVAALVQRSR